MARASTAYEPLAQAAQAIADGELERALTLASRPALASGPLADHALYYKGLAHLRLTRAAEAREIFEALRKRNPAGYLSISLALGEAEVSTALGDHARALGIYEKLTADKVAVSDLDPSQAGRGCPRCRGSLEGSGSPRSGVLRVRAVGLRRCCRGRPRTASRPRRAPGVQG